MIHQIRAKIFWFLKDVSIASVVITLLVSFLTVLIYYMVIKRNKKIRVVLYSFSCSISFTLIMMFTLLGRHYGTENSFSLAIHSLGAIACGDTEAILDFAFNILLFIPFGIVLKTQHSFFASLLVSLGLSVTIEICQLIFQCGVFEMSDLLGNFTGAILGILLSVVLFKLYNIIKKRLSHKADKQL